MFALIYMIFYPLLLAYKGAYIETTEGHFSNNGDIRSGVGLSVLRTMRRCLAVGWPPANKTTCTIKELVNVYLCCDS